MDLLSQSVRDAIYAANGCVFDDLKDTFFKTPIEFYKAGLGYNSSGEDNSTNGDKNFTPYLLPSCQFEQKDQKDALKGNEAGQLDEADVKITIFVKDLIATAPALWDTVEEKQNILDTEDYFKVKGEKYSILQSSLDGFFENRPVLLIILGKRLYKEN